MEYQTGEKVCWLNGGQIERGFIYKIINDIACYTKTHDAGNLHYNQRHELFSEEDAPYRVQNWKDDYDSYVKGGE